MTGHHLFVGQLNGDFALCCRDDRHIHKAGRLLAVAGNDGHQLGDGVDGGGAGGAGSNRLAVNQHIAAGQQGDGTLRIEQCLAMHRDATAQQLFARNHAFKAGPVP